MLREPFDAALDKLGALLDGLRADPKPFLYALYGFLGLLLVVNLFLLPHEPHFALDKYPGFWAVFGLGVCCFMILFLKKLYSHLVARPEDLYERD